MLFFLSGNLLFLSGDLLGPVRVVFFLKRRVHGQKFLSGDLSKQGPVFFFSGDLLGHSSGPGSGFWSLGLGFGVEGWQQLNIVRSTPEGMLTIGVLGS